MVIYMPVNIWKIYNLNSGESFKYTIDHRSYEHNKAVVKITPETFRLERGKKSGKTIQAL